MLYMIPGIVWFLLEHLLLLSCCSFSWSDYRNWWAKGSLSSQIKSCLDEDLVPDLLTQPSAHWTSSVQRPIWCKETSVGYMISCCFYCACVCSVVSDSLQPPELQPPGSSVHEISWARILERVAISFSRGSSRPRDRTCVSCIGRWVLYCWASREAHTSHLGW